MNIQHNAAGSACGRGHRLVHLHALDNTIVRPLALAKSDHRPDSRTATTCSSELLALGHTRRRAGARQAVPCAAAAAKHGPAKPPAHSPALARLSPSPDWVAALLPPLRPFKAAAVRQVLTSSPWWRRRHRPGRRPPLR